MRKTLFSSRRAVVGAGEFSVCSDNRNAAIDSVNYIHLADSPIRLLQSPKTYDVIVYCKENGGRNKICVFKNILQCTVFRTVVMIK